MLCVRASTYTCVNRICPFFWSVLQEYAYVRMWGTMLYNAQVSTELVRRVTKVNSDFSTVPLSLSACLDLATRQYSVPRL